MREISRKRKKERERERENVGLTISKGMKRISKKVNVRISVTRLWNKKLPYFHPKLPKK